MSDPLKKHEFTVSRALDWGAIVFLKIFCCLGVISLALIAAMGFFTIGQGVWSFYKHCVAPGAVHHEGSSNGGSHEALHLTISGLEFLLLAPLSYLLLRSLADYIEDLAEDNKISEVAKESILEAKILSIGLLFSIVATHLIGKLILAHGEQQPLQWPEVSLTVALLAILGSVYLYLQRLCYRH